MASYLTPGVYVEEISTFPASVVRVATAVPVFIGYTEIAGATVLNKAVKIRSLVDYAALYGGEPTSDGRSITVKLDANSQPATVTLELKYYLYQSLRHFFANGGGDAYILSVGTYSANGPDKNAMIAALAQLEKVDEPTLVLVPDAYAFTDPQDLGDVQVQVLAHCAKMQDRFGLMDVLHDTGGNGEADDALAFRNKIGTNNLSYGAAYYPELLSTLGPDGAIASVDIALLDSLNAPTTFADVATATGDTGLLAHGQAMNDIASLDGALENGDYAARWASSGSLGGGQAIIEGRITILKEMGQDLISMTITHPSVIPLWNATTGTGGSLNTSIATLYRYYLALFDTLSTAPLDGGPIGTVIVPGDFPPLYGLAGITNPVSESIYGAPPAAVNDWNAAALASYGAFNALYTTINGFYTYLKIPATSMLTPEDDLPSASGTYSTILQAIRDTGYILPPSGAIAGIYAVTDAARGVWKAPANVSLNAVREVRKFHATELDDLNMPSNGKAINAIRFFRGQGILVYGSRTLNGNDNEWRFVNVRRLFLMAEESIRKACEFLVFEPNDASLWQRVKGMIENFLSDLWRDGALAGSTPKEAFFVKVGLGQTMVPQDILEGKLIVEVGMAAVRPAEFVIMKFMHKMQES